MRRVLEHLVEVFIITEYKDGCVYRTESVGMQWVALDAVAPKDHIFASPSSSYKGETLRTRIEP